MVIIDAHVHLTRDANTIPFIKYTAIELFKDMNKNGVDLAVVCPNIDPYATEIKNVSIENDWIASNVKTHPTRLIGFGLTTPDTGENMGAQEVERCITQLNMKGILLTRTKLLPAGYYVDSLAKIFEKCIELHVPILMDGNRPGWNGDDIAFIAQQFPKATVIMGSMGGHNWEQFGVVETASEATNIVFDISDCYFNPIAITRAIMMMGKEKVVWGSREPYNSQSASLKELHLTKLERWSTPLNAITQEEFEAMAGGNMARILKMETEAV
jgi:predicted TIM-barrel fold metal-dependent hydrolase